MSHLHGSSLQSTPIGGDLSIHVSAVLGFAHGLLLNAIGRSPDLPIAMLRFSQQLTFAVSRVKNLWTRDAK